MSTCHAQIVSDLRTLRELADALLRYDCVTFLTLLDTLRLSESRGSVWLLHSAAHTIFEEVRPPTPYISSAQFAQVRTMDH